MGLKELEFASFNERDTIKAWIYTPIRKPRGIVQVVHGFGDHSRRYFHLILELNEAGFVVCADDHVGHGKTAGDSDTWGDFGSKGWLTTVEDEKTLHDLTVKLYPGLPFFMVGHSWGSMIIRGYAARYGEDPAGIIAAGTSGVMENLPPIAKEIEGLVKAGRGSEPGPRFIAQLFNGWTDRYENPRTGSDWNSADPGVVEDGINDPFCGNSHMDRFTLQSIYDLAGIIMEIGSIEWAKKIPAALPVFLLAGDQDPVGNYGEGVYTVANWLARTGHKKVRTKLYSGYRHEILQERDIRREVEQDIIAFIDSII
ncbi:MAG: lysophospholipase [Spirochaetaceae bacterium]|jgi:alpha-beta hydrolase superfamily lysophospholipase|nr:lysophospholipase [Spirochaetaceae bacterium]